MDLTEEYLKHKMAQGMVVFTVRRVIVQILISVTNIILARLLLPEIFGAFAIIGFFISTFGLVANFGLGPALIQKRGKVTTGELRAIFTAVVVGALVFVGLIFVLAPLIDLFYRGKLGSEGVFWLRLFSLSVLFDHTATVSSHMLQRELSFSKFTVGEVVTTLVTLVATVVLVLSGGGLGALVLGNLIGKFSGAVLYFALRPWSIGFSLKFHDLKSFLPFGLNYQATNLIGAANGAVVPLVVGKVSGPAAVGFVNWAGGVRGVAMSASEVVGKVVFPGAARAQAKPLLLKKLTEKLIRVSALFSFPLLTIIFALSPAFTRIVYTEKWLPGLLTLQLSLIQGFFLLIGTVIIDVLLAIGKSKDVRNIWIFWTILQWMLTIPLVLRFGFNGVVVAGIIVSATFFIPLRILNRSFEVRIWSSTLPYLLYSLLAAVVVYVFTRIVPVTSVLILVTGGLLGVLSYFCLLLLFERRVLVQDLLRLRRLTIRENIT